MTLPGAAELALFWEETVACALRNIRHGEHPVGAAILQPAKYGMVLITATGNTTHSSGDATSHAEMTALRKAQAILMRRHLSSEILLTTCEPCPMCAGAAVACRVGGVVYGTSIADIADLKAKQSDMVWRFSKLRCSDIFLASDCTETPIAQTNDPRVLQRCAELLNFAPPYGDMPFAQIVQDSSRARDPFVLAHIDVR